MSYSKLRLAFFLTLLSHFAATSYADNNSETKLREALRNTMLQLRTAQNERATLQATQAENDARIKTLSAQVDKLTKEASNAEKASNEQEAQLSKFKDAVQNWQAAYKQAVDLANSKEDARAKATSENILLKRRVDDQKTKNQAMYRTANEILTRYERFGLGDALAAKEPFVGLTRVRLENLVQDYQDKLLDERIRSSDGPANQSAAAPNSRNSNLPAPAKPTKP